MDITQILESCPVEIYQTPEEFSKLLELLVSKFGSRKVNVMEIGSMYGGTLWCWLSTLSLKQLTVIDKLVETFDSRYNTQKHCHELWGQWCRYNKCAYACLEQDSAKPSAISTAHLIASQVDILFIDGDHTYEGVKADYNNYKDLVRTGGVIIFHDIAYEKDSVYFGVKPLWEELKKEYPKYEEFVTNPAERGIGVLYV